MRPVLPRFRLYRSRHHKQIKASEVILSENNEFTFSGYATSEVPSRVSLLAEHLWGETQPAYDVESESAHQLHLKEKTAVELKPFKLRSVKLMTQYSDYHFPVVHLLETDFQTIPRNISKMASWTHRKWQQLSSNCFTLLLIFRLSDTRVPNK